MKKQLTTKSMNLLTEVSTKLSKELQVEGKETWFVHFVETVLPGGKRFKEIHDYTTRHFEYVTEDYKFVINAYNDNTIELFWIENTSAKKGIGSTLMNALLDIADEMNINIRLLAVPFSGKSKTNTQQYALSTRLFNYYIDFGFKRTPRTPEFIYNPS